MILPISRFFLLPCDVLLKHLNVLPCWVVVINSFSINQVLSSLVLSDIFTFNLLQARLQVSEVVLEQIKQLNHLDLELYKYAKDIFAKQHNNTVQTSGSSVSLFIQGLKINR